MTGYDGPTLRAVRENLGVPLRRIARQAGMSHGHLSKVERGEHGRPVTPAIVAAYEKVTGVVLADAAAAIAAQQKGAPRRGRVWVPGQITDIRRRGFNAALAALTLGGPLGDPYTRVLDATGRPGVPGPPELTDVVQVELVSGLFTGLDLRFGGGLVSQLAKYVLRWVVGMLDAADVDEAVAARLDAAVAQLAGRAAWAAVDVDAHEPARALFRLALFTAVRAGDPDLRGHLLADVAAQHSQLGYYEDALQIIRMVEGDERLSPAVRMVVAGVKARAYGGLGRAEECRRQVGQAEQAHAQAHPAEPAAAGWLATVCTPAQLAATTGHALAALALRTGGEPDWQQAVQRLAWAAGGHDPVSHARAVALCAARLAVLQLAENALAAADLEQGAQWAGAAVDQAASLHSSRLLRALTEVRAAAVAHGDQPVLRELVTRIDSLTQADEDR